MYQLQEEPDKEFTLTGGGKITPLATLKDEYGGVAQICIDDHCYVLYLSRPDFDRDSIVKKYPYQLTTHWFGEAVAVLKKMPIPGR